MEFQRYSGHLTGRDFCSLSSPNGEVNGTPFQYSCLENPMDGGAWWAAVHGVAKSRTRLSDFTFSFHFHELEKETATYSSVLAWRIPGTGEPGGLPSLGSHRVGHDWSDLAAAAAPGLVFCWLYRPSPSLAAKNIVNLISVLIIWCCLCVESSLVLLQEGVCYDPQVYSLCKTLLGFALLHSVLQCQICPLFQVFLVFLLFHSSPP